MTYAVAHMPSRLSTGSALWKTSLYPSSKVIRIGFGPSPLPRKSAS